MHHFQVAPVSSPRPSLSCGLGGGATFPAGRFGSPSGKKKSTLRKGEDRVDVYVFLDCTAAREEIKKAENLRAIGKAAEAELVPFTPGGVTSASVSVISQTESDEEAATAVGYHFFFCVTFYYLSAAYFVLTRPPKCLASVSFRMMRAASFVSRNPRGRTKRRC